MRGRQTAEPWAMGATSLALSRELGIDERELIATLRECIAQGLLISRAGYVATTDFEPRLTDDQRAFFQAVLPVEAAVSNLPADRRWTLAQISAASVAGLARAYDTLVAQGALVEVGEDLYRDLQIARIRAALEAFLKANARITMAQFRDLLGTSRRYAVPLLEWFDAGGVTVREGDERVAPNSPP